MRKQDPINLNYAPSVIKISLQRVVLRCKVNGSATHAGYAGLPPENLKAANEIKPP
jgi:hypothetical protein